MSVKVLVIIPAFRASDTIEHVVRSAAKEADHVLVVDDCCPDETGRIVEKIDWKGKRKVTVVYRKENGGVGAAMKTGFEWAKESEFDIFVKVDADGQMDCSKIGSLVDPIIDGRTDYAKGNRFDSVEDLERMPKIRILGNAILSLCSKISSGFWTVNDSTNGFFAIDKNALFALKPTKLRDDFFFESDLLFRLSVSGCNAVDVPHRAIYENETSNLSIARVVFTFPALHLVNFLKRYTYQYFVREWSLGTIYTISSLLLTFLGLGFGAFFGISSLEENRPWSSAQSTLFSISLILAAQFAIAFLTFDIQSERKFPSYSKKRN